MGQVKTISQLFIIESLSLKDEKNDRKEGDLISKMLHLAGKNKTIYYYVRTRRELEEIIKRFGKSKHRYLHISCHANKSDFATTFDSVGYDELGNMLRPHLRGRRVFVSACEMANNVLAKELFHDSGLLSLTGPKEDINFDDAAAFWVSFYHLIFKKNYTKMRGKELRETIKRLCSVYDGHINYFGVLKKNSRFKPYYISSSGVISPTPS